MKFVIQRVQEASVTVDQTCIGQIHKGFLVLIGIGKDDTREIADQLIKKMIQLRIFEDENGKTNLALKDVDGSLLLVSQFTLYANCKKGNRPSFVDAMRPPKSKELWEDFNKELEANSFHVETGEFGADMQVELENDGPFTIVLDL